MENQNITTSMIVEALRAEEEPKLLLLAADRLEELQRDLAQAISERTPHDHALLRVQRDSYRNNLCECIKERDEARAEVERVSEEARKWKFDANGYVECINKLKTEVGQLKVINEEVLKANYTMGTTRPDPSRLEIAAQFYAAGYGPVEDALKRADALIAAAKEDGK